MLYSSPKFILYSDFLSFFFLNLTHFWLCWVFVAVGRVFVAVGRVFVAVCWVFVAVCRVFVAVCWVFVAVCRFSLAIACRLLLLQSTGFKLGIFSRCSTRAQ